MIVKLAYDHSEVAVDLRGLKVRHLSSAMPLPAFDPGRLAGEALDHPVAGAPLVELARAAERVTVVVPDHTRKADLPLVLPAVVSRLRRAAPTARICLLVACGTHPRVAAGREEELYGRLAGELEVVHHDSRDEGALVAVGRLDSGLPLRLNRWAVDCDLLVTVGAVRHHYFAGFGGGPKMIFPGVAGYAEIQANHARVLLRDTVRGGFVGRHPGCVPGLLAGNPVAEEIAAAADLRPPDLSLCLVTTRTGGVGWAAAGPWRAAFAAAVARVRDWHEVAAERWPLVVASGGGAPSAGTLIQCHKALDAACRFAEDGGDILLVAGLGDGAGSPDMAPFLADPTPAALLARLGERWVQYGHTTLRIVDATSRYRVFLVSALDPDLARRLGFVPVAAAAEVVERWRHERPGATVVVLAGAPVYPRRST